MATAALVVGVLAGCSEGPGLTEVSQPPVESFPTEWLNGALYDTELTTQTAALYVEATGAMLVSTGEGEQSRGGVKAMVGEDGGMLRVGNHSLRIPRDAVDDPTVFMMEVVLGTELVVSLRAYDAEDGVSVSEFDKDLTLTLSYEGIVTDDDSWRLRNVYLFQDSSNHLVPLYSVLDEENNTISSPIDHFSLYGMAIE